MDQNLSVVLTMGVFVITTASVIMAWFNYRIKKRIIETGPVNLESIKLFNNNIGGPGVEALKWGCVVFFGGMGLVLIEYMPYRENSPLPYGLVAMFVALGFLSYWFIVNKKNDKAA